MPKKTRKSNQAKVIHNLRGLTLFAGQEYFLEFATKAGSRTAINLGCITGKPLADTLVQWAKEQG